MQNKIIVLDIWEVNSLIKIIKSDLDFNGDNSAQIHLKSATCRYK